MTLSSRDAIFNNLATMLVTSNLGEMLDHRLVNDRTSIVRFHQNQALSEHMIAPDITAELKNTATRFKRLIEQVSRLVTLPLAL